MSFENVETDSTVGVDIGVVDGSEEANSRWLEGVLLRELNV